MTFFATSLKDAESWFSIFIVSYGIMIGSMIVMSSVNSFPHPGGEGRK